MSFFASLLAIPRTVVGLVPRFLYDMVNGVLDIVSDGDQGLERRLQERGDAKTTPGAKPPSRAAAKGGAPAADGAARTGERANERGTPATESRDDDDEAFEPETEEEKAMCAVEATQHV